MEISPPIRSMGLGPKIELVVGVVSGTNPLFLL